MDNNTVGCGWFALIGIGIIAGGAFIISYTKILGDFLTTPLGIIAAIAILVAVVLVLYKRRAKIKNTENTLNELSVNRGHEIDLLISETNSFLKENENYINEWYDVISSISKNDYWGTNDMFYKTINEWIETGSLTVISPRSEEERTMSGLVLTGSAKEQPKYTSYRYDEGRNLKKCFPLLTPEFCSALNNTELANKLNEIFNFYNQSFETDEKELSRYIEGIKIGVSGENTVNEYLARHTLAPAVYYKNVNLINPIGEYSFENDFIIVNNKGVFTIEVKNYQSGSVVITKDGRVLSDRENFIEQCEEHVTGLKAFFREHIPHLEDKVRGIVVFSNDNIIINNDSSYPVVRIGLLNHTINNYENCLSDEDIKNIARVLTDNKQPDKKFNHGSEFGYFTALHINNDKLKRFAENFPREQFYYYASKYNCIVSKYLSEETSINKNPIRNPNTESLWFVNKKTIKEHIEAALRDKFGHGEWCIEKPPYIYIHCDNKYHKAYIGLYEEIHSHNDTFVKELTVSSIKEVTMTDNEKQNLKANKKIIFAKEYNFFKKNV